MTRSPNRTTTLGITLLQAVAGLFFFTLMLAKTSAQQTDSTSVCETWRPLSPLNLERPHSAQPGPSPASQPMSENVASKIHAAAVRVVNFHPRQPNGFGGYADKGSGVGIQNHAGKIFVLTAAHIFADGAGQISLYETCGNRVAAQLVMIDRQWDIALLDPVQPLSLNPLTLTHSTPLPGTVTLIAGFGTDDRYHVTFGRLLGFTRPHHLADYETLKTSGSVRKGDSGGPVCDTEGNLIGIVWGTDGVASYASVATRIRSILESNTRFGFAPSSETKPEQAPVHSNNLNPNNTEQNQDAPTQPLRDENRTSPQTLPQMFPQTPAENPPSVRQILHEQIAAEVWPLLKTQGIDLLLSTLLPAVGITLPGVVLGLWSLRKWLNYRRRKKGSIPHAVKAMLQKRTKTLVDSHNDYATELNDLYNFNGRNTTADATLGRLYDTELAQLEKSSDAKGAAWAEKIRQKIRRELCRIHADVPIPISDADRP